MPHLPRVPLNDEDPSIFKVFFNPLGRTSREGGVVNDLEHTARTASFTSSTSTFCLPEYSE
eukprot:8932915-Pyramimonas_sp.AAC.1